MKRTTILAAALLLVLSSAYDSRGQTVTLGDATFDATSNQARSDGYFPMRPEIIQKFSGYGDYAGLNRTHKYHRGEPVLGVNTVNCSERGASELPGLVGLVEPTGELTTKSEDSSLALDTQGNVRLLRRAVNGFVRFQASAEVPPPILFPVNPTVGKSWAVLGQKVTVVSSDASIGGFQHLLKLKFEPTDDPTTGSPASTTAVVEYRYYQAGIGLVAIESTLSDAASGSGWRLDQP